MTSRQDFHRATDYKRALNQGFKKTTRGQNEVISPQSIPQIVVNNF